VALGLDRPDESSGGTEERTCVIAHRSCETERLAVFAFIPKFVQHAFTVQTAAAQMGR
jgi:hypothetical protein